MCGLSLSRKPNPEISFVCGDYLQVCGFACDGKICFGFLLGERSRTCLSKFFIDQPDKNNFRIFRSISLLGQAEEGMKKRSNGSFGIAGTPPVKASIFDFWNKGIRSCWYHIHVRRKHNFIFNFPGRLESNHDIFPARQNLHSSVF